MDVQWLRSKVAVVSQEPSLLAGTVADAIRYGRPDASLEEVQTAARAANAHEFIEALPQASAVVTVISLSDGGRRTVHQSTIAKMM